MLFLKKLPVADTLKFIVPHVEPNSSNRTVCFALLLARQGQGEVAVIEMRAQAQAAAIRIISEALGGENSSEAAKLAVAREVSLFSLCISVSLLLLYSV